MGNKNRPERWKNDIDLSVDFYNDWFLDFAPEVYRMARNKAIDKVAEALSITDDFRDLTAGVLQKSP